MTLRADLLRTVLIQGLGAAALLAAVIYLGAVLGPEAQGRFSRTKAEVEFVAALAMAGLPQAMFYFVQKGALPVRRALRIALLAAVAGAVAGLAYGVLAGRGAGLALAFALSLAAAACVWHGELRALLLTLPSPSAFNAVTALPQALMLCLALLWSATSVDEISLAGGFAIAYLAPAALAQALLMRHEPAGAVAGATPPGSALFRFGAAAWLTAALGAAALVIMQRTVEQALGPAALGVFTMALALAQVPLLPVSYAAPLLFRHWMRSAGPPPTRALLLPPTVIGAGAIVLMGAISATDIGVGDRYAALRSLVPLLLAGTAAESLLRLLGAHANAAGRPWGIVVAEALRCASLVAAGLFGVSEAGLWSSGMAWVASTWGAALLLLMLTRHEARGVVR